MTTPVKKPLQGVDYAVHLEAFDGPLELLLYLIQKNEVDIWDIPMVQIARQYDEYLQKMEAFNLDIASEFIVMASNLLHIKSRMLLPKDPTVNEEGEEIADDPRAELVEQLILFRAFKAAAEILKEKEFLGRYSFPRAQETVEHYYQEAPYKLEADLTDLMEAFQRILTRGKDQARVLLRRDLIPLESRVQQILDILEEHEAIQFKELFPEDEPRSMWVATFLALLELLKRQAVKVYQTTPFGDIVIYANLSEAQAEAEAESASEGETD